MKNDDRNWRSSRSSEILRQTTICTFWCVLELLITAGHRQSFQYSFPPPIHGLLSRMPVNNNYVWQQCKGRCREKITIFLQLPPPELTFEQRLISSLLLHLCTDQHERIFALHLLLSRKKNCPLISQIYHSWELRAYDQRQGCWYHGINHDQDKKFGNDMHIL